MKKLFVLLSTAVMLFSCSDDDEGEALFPVDQSELIGTWFLVTQIENDIVTDLNDCTSQNSLTFTETTIASQSFYKDEDSEECIDDGGVQESNYTLDTNTITISNIDDDSDSNEADITILNSTLTISGLDEDGNSIQNSYQK